MKTKIYFPFLFFISILSFGQNDSETKIKTEHISVKVTVNTLEELNTVIDKNDFDELFDISINNQKINLELKCEKGKSESLSYKITGNLDEKSKFKSQIENIKKMCKSYLSN